MQEYNYSNQTPTNKKVDTISIIIALIAVTLIVTGTYLLIQALKPNEKKVVVNPKSSSSVSLRNEINVISSTSSASSVIASSFSISASQSQTQSISSSQNSNSTSSSSSQNSSSSSSSSDTLQTGSTTAEALFRVDSISGGLAKLTVVKTGFVNTRWLQPGSYVNLDSSILPQQTVGANYVIPLTIGANQTNFTIQNVGAPVLK